MLARRVRDDEMAARWFQLGAFSPINRLHSTNEEFSGKEPWKFSPLARQVMGDALRLLNVLAFFAPDLRSLLFPDWETLPYDHFSPHQDLISERLSALWRISQGEADVVQISGGEPTLHPQLFDILDAAKVFVEYEPQSRIEGEIQHKSAHFAVTELWQVLRGESAGRDSARRRPRRDRRSFSSSPRTSAATR